MISWSKCAHLPPWWTSMSGEVLAHLQQALPNEAAGLVMARSDYIFFYKLPVLATRVAFQLTPDHVLKLGTRLAENGEVILSTVHSHPNGRLGMSALDGSLAWWSNDHLLVSFDLVTTSHVISFYKSQLL
ncbi:MAG: Mov34/MPN/PAD-1 family protein [Alicyclobacillaceae bacterium]|uniref:Mov34/MPN/PAD-1 family protein n=1 Tax=Alicyclobacillus sp. SP_1 TaxID=2942475 RepID=UPI00215797A2|nr:Mov34/MPN/PAD-1 family protein [Alicyclobacillus sp. SP_1]MCY0888928.1 Mov34/MPN/PAD-1 family protein [Alicyclobacillaceae bacterium]